MSDGNHASSCKGRVSVITASPQCAHEMECAPNRTMNPPPPQHWRQRRRHIGVMFSSLGHPRAYRACGGGQASSPGGRDRIPGDRIYGLVRTAHSSYIRSLSRSTRFRRRVYWTRERGIASTGQASGGRTARTSYKGHGVRCRHDDRGVCGHASKQGPSGPSDKEQNQTSDRVFRLSFVGCIGIVTYVLLGIVLVRSRTVRAGTLDLDSRYSIYFSRAPLPLELSKSLED